MKKEILLPIFKFWLFYIVIPIVAVILLNMVGLKILPHLLYYFVLFVVPFIFFIIPFQQVKEKIKKPWVVIAVALIIPYLFIYYICGAKGGRKLWILNS